MFVRYVNRVLKDLAGASVTRCIAAISRLTARRCNCG